MVEGGHVLGGAGGEAGGRAGVKRRVGRKGGKGNKGVYRLRIVSWNVGTLTGKSMELAKIPEEGGQYTVCPRDKESREVRESVVEIRRVNDRLIMIKLVVGECTLNVISAYASHAGLDEEVKRCFWEGLDEIVRQVSPAKKLFIGGDFNSHIGSTALGYGEVHGGFGFGERNG
ncbi:PREDICTED: uncharacterized protein LOC109226063 [Nicotiana attenuata]|uniref:uncharacterized protein LOC109226063 n=1 Tax=Nicotiana attenuata TaxID=49451 RepID=UPI000905AD35|nr:PREDICTED: uncharacterized protein LOC109226063 [Nicotiana attenuata]